MSLRRLDLKPEIPTSSMADIAFLLIVFFMLTTTFSASRGMTHIMPADSEPNDAANPAIFIQIFPSGDFQLDGVGFSFDQVNRVSGYLLEKLQVNARKPVILSTDHEALYQHMVSVFDQIKLAEKAMQVHNPHFALDLTLPNRFERNLYARLSN